MSLPANWNLVEVRGRYLDTDGTPPLGKVTFTPKAPRVVDPSAKTTIIGRPVSAALDNDGHFSIMLPAGDDPDVSPNGFTYTVLEDFPGGSSYEIAVNLVSQSTGIDLSEVAPVAPNSGDNTVPVTRMEFDALVARVTALENP